MAESQLKFIHDFSVKDIRRKDVSLKDYAGKVLLIVNVASKCGLTDSNYKELNVSYENYRNQVSRAGTPNEEIQESVCTRFKAEFPIFDKVEVNGKNTAPLYQFLKAEKGGLFIDGIKWNFTKFLVDKEGKVVECYGPMTAPLKIEKDIQNLLS